MRNLLAADALHYYLDDTTNRINNETSIMKKKRNSDKLQLRTGIYTSGVIATTEDNRRLVLYQTDIGHAGEFIDDILKNRSPTMPKPILMSDALSSNRPTVCEVVLSLCNSHGRRQFFDVNNHFKTEVEYVIERYRQIWQNEDVAIEKSMLPEVRLAYHQANSLPVMVELRAWGLAHLQAGTVEENSALGKAIRYFDKHYDGLTCFCRVRCWTII